MSSLTKEVSSLKVSDGVASKERAPSASSARKELKELKRATSKRRSSKQGTAGDKGGTTFLLGTVSI